MKKHVLKGKPKTLGDVTQIALKSAKRLTTIPNFAGLCALGTLSRSAATFTKTVDDARSDREELEES